MRFWCSYWCILCISEMRTVNIIFETWFDAPSRSLRSQTEETQHCSQQQKCRLFFPNVREMKLSHHLEKITSVWTRKWYWFRGLKCVLLRPLKAVHFLQQHSCYSFSVNWGRGGWHGRQALSSVLFSSLWCFFFFFFKIKPFEITQLPATCLVVFHLALWRFQTFSYTGCS